MRNIIKVAYTSDPINPVILDPSIYRVVDMRLNVHIKSLVSYLAICLGLDLRLSNRFPSFLLLLQNIEAKISAVQIS